MAKGETLEVSIPNTFNHDFENLSISIDERIIKIKKSISKKIEKNKYLHIHVINYQSEFDNSNNLLKLIKKFQYLKNKYLKLKLF